MAAKKTQRTGNAQSIARLIARELRSGNAPRASLRFTRSELAILLSIFEAWQAGEAKADRSATVTLLRERVRRAYARMGEACPGHGRCAGCRESRVG
jgi:hypothetical protein